MTLVQQFHFCFWQQTLERVCSVPLTVPGWGPKMNPMCLGPWQCMSNWGDSEPALLPSSPWADTLPTFPEAALSVGGFWSKGLGDRIVTDLSPGLFPPFPL